MKYSADAYLHLADRFLAFDERKKAKNHYRLAYETALSLWERTRSYTALNEAAKALTGMAITADSDAETLLCLTDALGYAHVVQRDYDIHDNVYDSYHECLELLRKILVHESETELQQKITALLDAFFIRHPDCRRDYRLRDLDEAKKEKKDDKKTNR